MKDKQMNFILILMSVMAVFVVALLMYNKTISLDFLGNLFNKPTAVKAEKPKYPQILTLNSRAFVSGAKIPEKYTCSGEDINPPLNIGTLPEGTKSLVLIVDDPDAPYQTWTHWIVYNIDPRQKNIAENAVPWNSKLGTNDFGTDDYRGPCPPTGTHRYYFRLYALDTILSIEKGAKRKEIEEVMQSHILDIAELIGTFSR